MVSGTLSGVRHLLHRFTGTKADPRPDGQLLARYVTERDEAAFTALVERYGSLVFGVCRRVLRDTHDAEDAFQATFLVLARRAGSLDGRGPLGNWLYGVAYRTALKAKANAARRRAHERQALDMAVAQPMPAEGWSELWPVFDEELNRLPEKYRAPLVLCFLEGMSHQEAARALGWPSGSMSRRMLRARELLRERLTRRGVVLSAAVLFALLGDTGATPAVPAGLKAATATAAAAFGTRATATTAAISPEVAALADSILKLTAASRLKGATTLLATLALVGVIAGSGTLIAQQVVALYQQGHDTSPCAPAVMSPPSKANP